MGRRLSPADVQNNARLCGRHLRELSGVLDSIAQSGALLWMIGDTVVRPRARVTLANDEMHMLRERKSPAQLAVLRRAAQVTSHGILRGIEAIAEGALEGHVQAAIEQHFRSECSGPPAFNTIGGSGPNSTVPHYFSNARAMDDGDLVVIDAGAWCGHYARDITRTVPVSRPHRTTLRAE